MTSPPGAQQQDGFNDSASLPQQQQNQLPTLQIPKNRSSGNLLSPNSSTNSLPGAAASASRTRASLDAGQEVDTYDSLTRSPILSPTANTGLRRIRQQPPPPLRKASSPNIGPTPTHSNAASPHTSPQPSRKSSMHMLGPASPALPFSEDLTRFPSESLHSFSFAHQSDGIHNRTNVLKRSIEFMRDKLGWAASTPRIASAQAKLSGDEELLSMMELLQKANMMGPDGLTVGVPGLGVDVGGPGPLTGPAHLANENVFERSFLDEDGEAQSPASMASAETPTIAQEQERAEREALSRTTTLSKSPTLELPGPAHSTSPRESIDPLTLARSTTPATTTVTSPTSLEEPSSPKTKPRPQRLSLKRTYTDTASYSLQHKLTEALAQPYNANGTNNTSGASSTAILSPTGTSATLPSFRPPPPHRSGTTAAVSERAPHGHRNNQAQAIFTTESQAPWTITSANDLACLVFGVTRAEVRKLGILSVIEESRRKWLEERLGGTTSMPSQSSTDNTTAAGNKTTSRSGMASALGGGITAKLLSKPPSRQSNAGRRSKTEGGNAASLKSAPTNPHHSNNKSRGVLLCGDVIPIRKLNGSTGSASLWVKEKGTSLIWVLEEIAEDVAWLTIDEIGSILNGNGDIQAIWGLERVRNGMDVQRLIPAFPKMQGTNTGAVDYDAVSRLRGFTARTLNSISIPISVEQSQAYDERSGTGGFRVSSFPHIAGILVLEPKTMKVRSSNSVFASALFGHNSADGLPVSDIIPSFSDVLRVMTEEEGVELVDGIVIPEHSFRRARAVLALREGKAEAAAEVFLRPSGLPARHRDGEEIMIDVQMRVVLSGSRGIEVNVIQEEDESAGDELVYALWITYSRQLHAANHGVGPVTPILSRPSTPPTQPMPGRGYHVHGDSVVPSPPPKLSNMEDHEVLPSSLSERLQEAKSQDGSTSPVDGDGEPFEHPAPDMISAGVKTVKKKRIEDFSILEEMGQGAYGQVKLTRYKKSGAKKMVVKYVTKRRILVDTWHRDRRLGTVPLEIHVLDYLRRDGLQHPNIVEMADFFEDDINYYIEMFPHGLPGMDLFDYIELRVTMDETECRKIFVQVADALRHLHVRAKVVHRDIKDENVVLDGEGRVKLVDFGSAAYVKSGPFDVFVGTIDYAAPEVLRGHPYRGKEQDVWALGILLYTIVYKENPFYSIDEIMDHDLRVPYIMSEACIDLIRRMLDRDVEKRIGIQAVLDHPWCAVANEEAPEAEAEKS